MRQLIWREMERKLLAIMCAGKQQKLISYDFGYLWW